MKSLATFVVCIELVAYFDRVQRKLNVMTNYVEHFKAYKTIVVFMGDEVIKIKRF